MSRSRLPDWFPGHAAEIPPHVSKAISDSIQIRRDIERLRASRERPSIHEVERRIRNLLQTPPVSSK